MERSKSFSVGKFLMKSDEPSDKMYKNHVPVRPTAADKLKADTRLHPTAGVIP